MADHWCRWEYRVFVHLNQDGSYRSAASPDEAERELNKLGAEGWEAFAFIGGIVHLKRQILLRMALEPKPPSKPVSPLIEGIYEGD